MMDSRNIDGMTRTTQEMVETQRDAQEAVVDNLAAFQRNSVGLARDGLRFVELQQENARVAREWWANGLRLAQLQQRNAEFVRGWMNDVARAVRDQGEQNVRTAEVFARSYRAQQENFQSLAGMWFGAYRDLFTSFVDYAQEGVETAQRATEQGIEGTQQAARQGMRLVEQTSEAAAQTARQNGFLATLENGDYDEMNVAEISKKLDDLSADELKKVRAYEKQHKNRDTLIEQIDRKIKASS